MSQQALGSTQPPISKVTWLCPVEDEVGRDTDWSPASIAGVNIASICNSTARVPSWCAHGQA